jgi:hypothetical protein
MVPMDNPEVSLDMLRNLVFGVSFESYEQKLERASQGSGGENCPVCPPQTTCEACPVCPSGEDHHENQDDHEDQTDNDSSTIDEEHPPVTITIPYLAGEIWIASSLAAVVLIAGLCWFCGCCRRSKSSANPVPQYDMELPSSSYTDKPEEYGEVS